VKPWLSAEDIAKGARGGHEIAQKLASANFGIVCLTPSNLRSEWIHFEAGALSKHLENSALFTFLVDLKPTDVQQPLGSFQHTQFSKDEIRKLTEAINAKVDRPLPQHVLERSFETFWPQLEEEFSKIPTDPQSDQSTLQPVRKEGELLAEVLTIVRGLNQTTDKLTDTEVVRRKGSRILGFARGMLRGRKIDAQANLELAEDTFTLSLKLDNSVERLEIEASTPPSVYEESIDDFIIQHTFCDLDIPF